MKNVAPLAVAVLLGVATPVGAHEERLPDGFEPPVLVEESVPPYPAGAEAAGIEGEVHLHIDIDAKGEVFRVELVSSPHESLSFAAMGAATRMRFRPALLREEPVPVRIDHVIRFELEVPHVEPLVATSPALDEEAVTAELDRDLTEPDDVEVSEGWRPLEQDAAVELGLVIRERAVRRSSSEARIERDELLRANRKSANDLLGLVPGVHVAQHGAEGKGAQIFLRGFDVGHGSDVEVTVDGIPVNEASHVHGQGYLDLGFVIPEAVERIDVYKGAHRLGQGPFATAGTVAFALGVPDEDRGVGVRYELGDTNRHRALALYAPRDQPAGTFVAAEVLHDDGFGATRAARRASVLARMSVPVSGSDELFALGSLYAAGFEAPGAVRLDDVEAGREELTGSYLDDTGGVSLQALAAVGYRMRLFGGEMQARGYGRARHLSLDENYTGFLLEPVYGDRRLQRQTGGSVGASLDYERPLAFGLEGFTLVGWESDVVEQSEHALGQAGEARATKRDLAFAQQRTRAATGVRWHGLGWLYLEGGLRVDVLAFLADDRQKDEAGEGLHIVASPRVLAAVGPFAGVRFFGAYGRGFRPPEARAFSAESAASGGTPEPTLIDSGELGLEWLPSRRLRTSLTAFAFYVEREVLFDHLTGTYLAMNASTRLGAEASARVVVARWLEVGADVTAVDARYLESGAPLPGVPPLLGTMSAAWLVDRAFLAARWLVLGARPLGYGAYAAPAAVLDVSAGYDLGLLSVDVAVDNALDAAWAEAAYAYASHWDRSLPRSQLPAVHVVAGSPRTVRVGLSARF